MTRRTYPLALFLFLFLLFPLMALAQVDPGVRGGAAGAGGPLASVAIARAFWYAFMST